MRNSNPVTLLDHRDHLAAGLPDILELLFVIFSDLGDYTILRASDGQEALRMAPYSVNLIVLKKKPKPAENVQETPAPEKSTEGATINSTAP